MDYALMVYPLSRGYQQRFEEAVASTPRYLTLGALRQLSFSRLFKTLRGIDGRLFLPMEDTNAGALLPVLQALAAATRADSIRLIRPDLSMVMIPRRRVVLGVFSLVAASISGCFSLRHCRHELAELLDMPRYNIRHSRSGRVLYLKTNLWLGVKAGGSIGHIAGVVNGFVGRGWGVDFFSAESPVMLRAEVVCHQVQALKAYGLPSEVNLYHFHRSFLRQARNLTDGHNIAFIYQRMSVANYVGVQLSREYKLPLVIEYNGSEVWIARNWGTPLRFEAIAEQAEQACLRHAHLVVTVSNVLRDELVGRGVEPERIAVYPNGIDPQVFDPKRYGIEQSHGLRARYDIPADALLVTFVGTFGQWHGADVLARAIRNLAVHDPKWLIEQRLHFLLVGDGMKMSEVRAILDDERCKPFVTLTGLVPQAETPLYLAASDIFLSPHVANQDGSRFFGSPTKLFEYMAMGRAIVASDLDQISEVLAGSPHISSLSSSECGPTQNQCALLVRPGEVAELEAAVRFLAAHPEWRHVLGRNARQRVLEKYTWDSHVAAIVSGLDRALSKRSDCKP